ncbi:MAG: DUF1579 family protein [Planctomycetes bacterium]|nr:DUF1579 family protein [Planctomycetota bacterium]
MRLLHATACALVALGSFSCASTGASNPAIESMQEGQVPPAPQHILLQKAVGEYAGTVTVTLLDGTEQTSEATEKVTSLGPYWIKSEFRMDMGEKGVYEGHGCYGYDVASGKYVGTWIDSSSSNLAQMEGDMDLASRTMVMNWMGPDGKGAMVKHRSESEQSMGSYKRTFFTSDMKTMEVSMYCTGVH